MYALFHVQTVFNGINTLICSLCSAALPVPDTVLMMALSAFLVFSLCLEMSEHLLGELTSFSAHQDDMVIAKDLHIPDLINNNEKKKSRCKTTVNQMPRKNEGLHAWQPVCPSQI